LIYSFNSSVWVVFIIFSHFFGLICDFFMHLLLGVVELLFWKSKYKMGSCANLFSNNNIIHTRQSLANLSNVRLVSPQSKSKHSHIPILKMNVKIL
jgi:hypothetical protein